MTPERSPRFAVAQLGARMHYAVPRILHRAGMLEQLYTDVVATKGWPRWLCAVLPERWSKGSLGRLRSRAPHGVPGERITALSAWGLEYWWRLRGAGSATELTGAFLWGGREFCRRIIRHGLGEADAVYAFNSAALELLAFARAQGLPGAVEQTIAPFSTVRAFIEQERERWPDWAPDTGQDGLAEEFTARERQEWQTAACILCPSEFVLDAVRSAGGPAERCRIVPYGVDLAPMPPRVPRAGKLRALFCGGVSLRKGVPYLLQAAAALPAERFAFRLIGSVQVSQATQAQLRRRVDLAGPVPRPEVIGHYRWADVFVFPSLCEGSATVCYEALAAGLPVITTPNAGSVVRDGIEGFIVPIRDGEAIAEKLELLASQAGLLEELSRNALARAQEFTVEKYGERLLAVLAVVRNA